MNQQQFQPPQAPPPNYLVFAILTTIFCCQIFGIVSIVYAAMVNSKWAAGDQEGAWNASRNAKLWAWISFGSAIVIWMIISLMAVLGIFAAIGFGGCDF
jgi:heme/copper-type cytochrome/quinol oxidase subunit 2